MTTPRNPRREAIPIPEGIDYSRSLAALAAEHHVCTATVLTWKRKSGAAPNRIGRPEGHHHPVYEQLTDVEWSMGPSAVARLAGVCRQAAFIAGLRRGKYPSKRNGFPF